MYWGGQSKYISKEGEKRLIGTPRRGRKGRGDIQVLERVAQTRNKSVKLYIGIREERREGNLILGSDLCSWERNVSSQERGMPIPGGEGEIECH